MSGKTFLLYGYFGSGNLGDDLLLTACVEGIRAFMPDSRFLVRDHGMGMNAFRQDQAVAFIPIETIMANQSMPRPLRFLRYLAAYWSLLGQVGWMVFAGGTLFHQRGSIKSLLLQFAICVMAKLRGVKIVALGVGVAELRGPISRIILRCILRMSLLFTVRDKAALRQCASEKAELVGDLAFTLAASPRSTVASSPVVALAIYPPCFVGPQAELLFETLTVTVARWLERDGRVVFMVFQSRGAAIGDEAVLQDIERRLQPEQRRQVVWRHLKSDLMHLELDFADISVMCGMRYHGHVMAAMLGLPFVVLAHDNKLSSIAAAYAMPCLQVQGLSANALLDAVEVARGYIPSIERLIADKAAARQAFQKFESLVRLA